MFSRGGVTSVVVDTEAVPELPPLVGEEVDHGHNQHGSSDHDQDDRGIEGRETPRVVRDPVGARVLHDQRELQQPEENLEHADDEGDDAQMPEARLPVPGNGRDKRHHPDGQDNDGAQLNCSEHCDSLRRIGDKERLNDTIIT